MTEEEKLAVIQRNLSRLMTACKITDCILIFKSTDGLYGHNCTVDQFLPDSLMIQLSDLNVEFLKQCSIRIVYEKDDDPLNDKSN